MTGWQGKRRKWSGRTGGTMPEMARMDMTKGARIGLDRHENRCQDRPGRNQKNGKRV